jgi:galactose mutarotase-like enzyme
MDDSRLILVNQHLRAEILPSMGGKIASIRALPENHELLQQPLLPYAPRTQTMAFEAGDASGYDECVPSVSGCEIAGQSGTITIPDHGDFWRLPFEVVQSEDNHVVLEATGFSLPLRFRKTVRLRDSRLLLSYELQNMGPGPTSYLWSAHPGFAVAPGDRIVLPSSVDRVTVEWSARGRLGGKGTSHPWPIARTSLGTDTDLSLVGSAEERVGDKLFARAPVEGCCVLDRVSVGRRIEMRFDPQPASHLGIWLSYAGWPESNSLKQFCVALEPCTAPTDSLAVAIRDGWARPLAPQSTDRWQVEVQVSALEKEQDQY